MFQFCPQCSHLRFQRLALLSLAFQFRLQLVNLFFQPLLAFSRVAPQRLQFASQCIALASPGFSLAVVCLQRLAETNQRFG